MKSTFIQVCTYALILTASQLRAQTLATYEFTGSGACPQVNTAVTVQPNNAIFSAFTSVNTTCTASNDVFNNKAWNAGANVDLSEYNAFAITPGNCFRLNLVSIGFDHKLSTGTADWHLRSSLDHFASDLAAGTSTATLATENILLPNAFASIDTVVFRFYITGILVGTTTWRQDNVTVAGTINAVVPVPHFVDADNDGFGTGAAVMLCSNPGGYALVDGDCNDNNAQVHPDAIWYVDLDGDGYGDPATAETSCTSTLENATLQGNDCDDADDLLNPETVWYEDADQDGFGDSQVTETGCESAFQHPTMVSGDCNDDEPTVHPGAPEICDTFDNDCNGEVNDGMFLTAYFLDEDGDGFGAASAGNFCEDPGTGYATASGDCDDSQAAIHPDAIDLAGNGIDENCDGTDGTLGITELNPAIFTLSPNPGTDFLTLTLNAASTAEIEIYNISGALINSMKSDNKTIQLNTSTLDAGIYWIQVKTSIQSLTARWIKSH